MSYFGKEKNVEILEYEKSKVNLLEEYKKVSNGIVPNPDCLVPLLNWFSNSDKNILKIQQLNKYFFYADKNVLNRGLVLHTFQKWCKYPKKNKDEHELSFLIPFICDYKGWSEREYKFNKDFINLEDRELHIELDRFFTFDKKICRKIGIKREKIKAKYEAVSKVKGFF